jgi:hypothetical protein
LLLGGSSGAVLHAARHQLEERRGNILCVLPDSGEKYLDTIYSDMWLAENGVELDSNLVNSVHVVDMDNGIDYESIASLIT